MTNETTVWDLSIHELLAIEKDGASIVVLRVPGGWLYNVNSQVPVFVPFTAEGRLAEKIVAGKRYEKRIIKHIIEIVLLYYNIVPETKLYEKTRKTEIVKARYQVIYFVSKYISKITLERLGDIFGLDHATVHHALKTVNNEIETNADYRLQIIELDNIIKTALNELNKK